MAPHPALSQDSAVKHLPERPTQKPRIPARSLLQPQEGGWCRVPAARHDRRSQKL